MYERGVILFELTQTLISPEFIPQHGIFILLERILLNIGQAPHGEFL